MVAGFGVGVEAGVGVTAALDDGVIEFISANDTEMIKTPANKAEKRNL